MCGILRSQQAFPQITLVYISSYGLYNVPDNQWTLKLFQGAETLIGELTSYYTLWRKYGEKIGLGAELTPYETTNVIDDNFSNLVGKLHNHISWHIGMTAYKLIKKPVQAKPVKEENEDESEEIKKKRKVEKYRE